MQMLKCDGCKRLFDVLYQFPRKVEHRLCAGCTAAILVKIRNEVGLAAAFAALAELVTTRSERWHPCVRRSEEFMPATGDPSNAF